MADNARLQLELRDVYGKFLGEKVDIILRHKVLSEVKKASPTVTAKVEIAGLEGAPQGRYQMEIDPPSYQYVSEFVNMKASGITSRSITFPIDPGKVVKVNVQAFAKLTEDLRILLDKSDKVLSFEGKKGKDLYDALDDIRKAGMLNIATKTNATTLGNGRTVLSYIEQLNEIRGDRFSATCRRNCARKRRTVLRKDCSARWMAVCIRRLPAFSPPKVSRRRRN